MQRLKWLYPGMFVKRWISLSVFGIIMVSMGFVMMISEPRSGNKAIAGVIIILGIMGMVYAVKRILKSFMAAVLPEELDSGLLDRIYKKRVLDKGQKIVVVGGGTGLSTLLSGLKHHTSNLTAIVTVSDDGGSSGRLREQFDVPPPGDIRNCLVALSDSEDLLRSLFQFRFQNGKELEGHNFGNLFITALSQITGDFAKAIKESSKVLAIRGRVFPATLEKIKLVAFREDGRSTVGESRIREEKGSPIDRMRLIPEDCEATPETVEAIKQADMIVLGPGSLYSSVMPNLLIKGIREEIIKSKAFKVYVGNVMTENGETDGYTISDHARAILKHTGPGILDFCIANITPIPQHLYSKYKMKEQYPVELGARDVEWFRQEKITLIKAHIASMEEFVRHDPVKLANAVVDVFNITGR
ncbi:MAG: YvcK family protein [Candidatus Omnitrophica bacterium]|nr:YvcK family protein [Candidatus Omnitrophota bacterium]